VNAMDHPSTLDWVSLTPRLARTDRLGGGWWPRTGDLSAELPPLLKVIEKRIGLVRGVLVHRADWAATAMPCTPPGSSRLRISWYGNQDPHTVILIGDNAKRVELVVIAPETSPDEAATILRMASQAGNSLDAQATLLAAARMVAGAAEAS
jgi:Family of unknown function (DUF5994)